MQRALDLLLLDDMLLNKLRQMPEQPVGLVETQLNTAAAAHIFKEERTLRRTHEPALDDGRKQHLAPGHPEQSTSLDALSEADLTKLLSAGEHDTCVLQTYHCDMLWPSSNIP